MILKFLSKENKWIDVDSEVQIMTGKIFYENKWVSSDKVIVKCEKCDKIFETIGLRKDRNYKFCKSCTRKITNLKKYGEENYVNPEKAKQTNLEKYGSTCSVHGTNEEKVREIKIKKYGSYNNIEKIKQTNLEKYGVEFTTQTDIMKNNSRKTKLEKYGDEFFTNREKAKQTSKEKYQDECYNNIEKSRQTKLLKYGNTSNFHGINEEKIKSIKISKYGSFNNSKKIAQTRFENFYDIILSTDRLQKKVIPLFSKSDYEGGTKSYLWKCVQCGADFEDSIENGKIPRCPKCYPKMGGISLLEKELADWIKSLGFDIMENSKSIIPPLELDIYIPSKNFAIEFDGVYWHSELNGINSQYHLTKTIACQERGIYLIHVFEDEWIDKKEIVQSIIRSKLGLNMFTIYGRHCDVKEISCSDAEKFFYKNHLQEGIKSIINIGLFFDDKLVSCLSLSKSRFNKKYQWEITRYANLLNTKIHGSFGKLWSFFIKKYNPSSVITYSDKRYFNGDVYRKYFREMKDSSPNYWYVRNRLRYNRIEFQKHKLQEKLEIFDPNLTEWQNMQLNGWDRIWDCGNKAFEFILPNQIE